MELHQPFDAASGGPGHVAQHRRTVAVDRGPRESRIRKAIQIPRSIGPQASAYGRKRVAAAPCSPRAAAVADQSAERQQALPQRVQLEARRSTRQTRRYEQQVIRVIGERVQIAQHRALQVGWDDEPGRMLQPQHGIPPPPRIVGLQPAARGEPPVVGIEPPEQRAAAQLHHRHEIHASAATFVRALPGYGSDTSRRPSASR